ncbi:MAG: amidohydrolase [Acidimicrobiales bacterium]|nr:amidohydrolase [Acidimicrobiales bacterium]
MTELGYRLVDADNHYYETRDAFTRHMPRALMDQAIHTEVDDSGREVVLVGDRPFTFLEHRNFDTVVPPGALRDMLRAMKSGERGGDVRHTSVVEPMQPAYVGREARLAAMDDQGVQAAFLFPTLAVCVEHFMHDDPDQLYANFRSFNTWLDEEWGFAHDNRIFAPPLMSLADVDRAVAELEWAIDRGTRAICLRPGPAYGRSPADPHFDPFWARVNEAELVVGFHIGESGYNEAFSVAWGEAANPPSHRQSALQWTCFYGDRPIMETLAAMIYQGLFSAFPNIRVMSVENGSLWVEYLLKAMNKMNRMGRNGPWPRGPLTEKPSEVFKRHVWVSPFHEEPVDELVDAIGAERVLFGSDWPHAEGTREPVDFAESLAGLDDRTVRLIMRDNASELLGLT